MPVRKSGLKPSSFDSAVVNLPDRFRTAEVRVESGQMTGLAAYMSDLTSHLQKELGSVSQAQVMDAMSVLGVEPAAWYRVALKGI